MHVCSYPGCWKASKEKRCIKHPYPTPEQRARPVWKTRGDKPSRINNAHWRKLRRTILNRDPVCKLCKRNPSTEVDHRVARVDGGTDDSTNLQGACKWCHASKTSIESARRRRVGRALNFRAEKG